MSEDQVQAQLDQMKRIAKTELRAQERKFMRWALLVSVVATLGMTGIAAYRAQIEKDATLGVCIDKLSQLTGQSRQ